MKNISLTILLLLFCSFANSQKTFFIKEFQANEAIPFVKVIPDNGSPFLSDIDGRIVLAENVNAFTLRYAGFKDTLIQKSQIEGSVIFMVAGYQAIQEVVAVAGENPAHRIMSQAIKNRKKNHPLKNDAFTYNSYSKFWFDIVPDSTFKADLAAGDSSVMEVQQFIDEQHLFMLESASKRTVDPPNYDKEEITAYKVSGSKNPMFSTFANSMQSFSFYDVQVELIGEQYINPLAKGGLRRYLYILEDTTVNNSDTTFTIFYRPRKGKVFKGMIGRLYINTNGFAIEKVTASPYNDTTGITVGIVQEYEFLENRKWFPTKLSTEVNFGSTGAIILEGGGLNGQGSSYIENVVFVDEKIKHKNNDNIAVYTSDNSVDVKEEDWDTLRRYELTDREERTYEMIDSLSDKHKLDYRLDLLTELLNGKIPLGNFNLDLGRLFDYNLYEGFRLGLGLETSKKMMKNVTIRGYGAYGFGDKDWKFGTSSTIHLLKRKGMKIDLKYQQDVKERGGTSFTKDGFNLTNQSAYRDLFIKNMDKQRLGEIAFSIDIKSNLTARVFGNYQRIWLTKNYEFHPNNPLIFSNRNDFDIAETGVEIQWDIREKNMMLGTRKVSLGTKYPRIKVKAVKGWKNWFESNYDYYRINAEISQTVSFISLGKFSWKIEGGTTVGDVPLFLSQVGNATGLNWNISTNQTFQTMLPGEFYSSSQAALYTHFTFKSIHTKATWNEPKITLHHALGYGDFINRGEQLALFQTMEKGYTEGGIILDGILTTSNTSIGLGGFYRYGAYANTDWKKNIVPKISVAIRID